MRLKIDPKVFLADKAVCKVELTHINVIEHLSGDGIAVLSLVCRPYI